MISGTPSCCVEETLATVVVIGGGRSNFEHGLLIAMHIAETISSLRIINNDRH